MNKRYVVRLSAEERAQIDTLVSKGKCNARKLKRVSRKFLGGILPPSPKASASGKPTADKPAWSRRSAKRVGG